MTTLLAALLLAPPAANRIVPGVSLGRLKIGASSETLASLGVSYAGDAAAGKVWSTWLGKGAARLDVYSSLAVDAAVIRIVRATSPSFRTSNGYGPGTAEARMRRAFPRAKSVGTYRAPGGGPPIHVFDDVPGGLAFELLRGKVLAVSVHAKGRGIESESAKLRTYLAQPLRRMGRL